MNLKVVREKRGTQMRLLLAEDDDAVREMLQTALERDGFEVVAVPGVRRALKCIATEKFDVLLSDLHMPHPGDGFTVVSAMRHTHPKALTLLLSGHPELDEAMLAIRSQADDVLVKPIEIASVGEIIHKKLATRVPHEGQPMETVASILEQDLDATIRGWVRLVEHDEELTSIPLDFGQRIGHLPNLLADLISRLLAPPASKGRVSISAREHGALRRRQGYTPAMLVEEFRILQISVFNSLQNNLRKVNFSGVLRDAITIADEVDLQLKQVMFSFMGDDSQWSAAWNAEPSKPAFQTPCAGIRSGSAPLQESRNLQAFAPKQYP
jgi:CheY-like chemotaxis protein